MNALHLFFVFGCLVIITESTESAKKIPNPEELLNISSKFMNDVRQDIHFIRNPEIHPEIQATFLSESVQKYLELGRSIPGRPGTDYPILSAMPYTNFYCDEQSYPGFFADVETRCQGWHYCDIDGRQASFLCPNGTQFSQAVFACDWWFNVNCDLSPHLYSINARLYQKPKVNSRRINLSLAKELNDEIFN